MLGGGTQARASLGKGHFWGRGIIMGKGHFQARGIMGKGHFWARASWVRVYGRGGHNRMRVLSGLLVPNCRVAWAS